jgi:hypothetical protein
MVEMGTNARAVDMINGNKVVVEKRQTTLPERRSTDMAEEKYVTYKQLFIASGGLLAIMISILGLFYAMNKDILNSKVNQEVYSIQYKSVCSDIDEIKKIVTENASQLGKFSVNQILVMRALKIEPAK